MHTYESGAKRSEKLPAFRDIDYGFLIRVAESFAEGKEKYEKELPPYEKNWKKGDQEFALDVLDHMISHAIALKENYIERLTGDYVMSHIAEDCDHLGHLGANLVMLDYFERKGFFDKSETVEAELFPEENDLSPGDETDTPNPPDDTKQTIWSHLVNLVK